MFDFGELSDEAIVSTMRSECDLQRCVEIIPRLLSRFGDVDARNVEVIVSLVTAALETLSLGLGISPQRCGGVVSVLAMQLARGMCEAMSVPDRAAN